MNDNDEPEERRIGAHTLRVVAPDVVVFTFVGTIEPSDLWAIHELLSRFAKDKPWIFAIVDMSRVTSLPMRSRHTATQAKETSRIQAAAVIGANRTMQVVVAILHKAISMLRHEPLKPLAFVETEAQGHAFIGECRRALEAKL